MKKPRTLPLGVDVGEERTRVALVERDASGCPRLVAVAARPTGDDPARAIGAACAELRTAERRCVLAIGAPDALLRTAAFPALRGRERARAARFEAARFVPYPLHEADVRVAVAGPGRCVLGIARRAAVDDRVAIARRAGLRPIAVDDVAFALLRAFPYAGAVLDVGVGSARLVFAGDPVPSVQVLNGGGRAFSAAVVASLGIDEAAAEQRKRTVGLGGAGEYVRDALVEQLASALIEHRAGARTELRTIAVAGNGARLAGFAEAVERAVAIPVRLGALPDGVCDALPAD
ncbi:MAG: Pilus-associated protein pilM, partial [Candidatus Eremiobacteraeota bacterium]|nr:Pilus-associated protein pilM [Candidatus Eremiobacteraeota bacterium]